MLGVVDTLGRNDSPESPEADWLDECKITKLSWDIENMGLE